MSERPTHNWRQVTAPNGDRGWQCQSCRLTCITLTDELKAEHCGTRKPIPTLSQLLRAPDAS